MLNEEFVSTTTYNFNSALKRIRFSDFISYSIYDDEKDIYINNDNSYGCIIECSARLKASRDTAVYIENIINKLPENTYMQVSLLGLKNISNIIEYWKHEHLKRAKENNDEYRELFIDSVNAMSDFYYEKTNEGICNAMPTTIKKYVLLFSFKSENKENLISIKENAFNILTNADFFPQTLKPNELKEYMYELFNYSSVFNQENKKYEIPPYNNGQYINRQIIDPTTKIKVSDDCLTLDNKHIITLTPLNFPPEAHISDFGEKLGNTIGGAVNENQFKDTFIITANITRLPQKRVGSAKKNHSVILSQKWDKNLCRKFNAVQEESVGILERIDNKKESLFAFDLNICVFGNSKKDAKANAETIKKVWTSSEQKIMLRECDGIHQVVFLNSLPMNVNDEYMFDIGGKSISLFPDQISQFIPLECDWGGNSPNMLFCSRRGNLTGLDLFNSSINFNGYIVATSGAGKSVLLNMLVFNTYSRGDRVFILDYDNSFTKLTEVLGGQYVNLTLDNPISFNPFSDIKTLEELKEEQQFLEDFVFTLGCSNNESEARKDEKFIKSIIGNTLLKAFDSYGSDMEITTIKDLLLVEEDKRIQDFATSLQSFSRGGIYEKFFSGKCEFDIKKELISIEFKGIEEHLALRDPLIMLLTYHIKQMMYHSDGRSNKIQIIFDEAHRFLGKNPRMDDFIEQAYRRARKYGGAIILATQGFGDIYDSISGGLSSAGKTITDNSSWKFFMRQDETSVAKLLQSGLFQFNDMEKQLLREMRTNKGNYSEFMVVTPEQLKVPLRLVMPKFFYYLTTTDMNDKLKIKSYTDKGFSITKAIEQVIKDDNNKRVG